MEQELLQAEREQCQIEEEMNEVKSKKTMDEYPGNGHKSDDSNDSDLIQML